LAVVNGTLLTRAGLVTADLTIAGGRISGIVAPGNASAAAHLDARGLVVLPGAIDAHVHFRDPGFPEKEDFGSGSAAAAFGGVTTVLDMPNTAPPVMTTQQLAAKRAHVGPRAWVDFGLYAALDGSNLERAAEMAAGGAVAFKIFMYQRPSPPPRGITDDSELLEAFRSAALTGLPVAVHAENESLVRSATAAVLGNGNGGHWRHLASRPSLAEAEAVSRAILFSHAAGARLHICHLSSREGLDVVREAQRRGHQVTAETTPQHLLLDDSMYDCLGARLKMVPPVRSRADAEALWAAAVDGTLALVATDHAPHEAREKLVGDIVAAASGVIGVETTVPLLLTEVAAGRLSWERFSGLLSEGPARTFGLWPAKGSIAVGADADLALVDLAAKWVIEGASLHSRCRVTPFEGREVQGRVIYTMLRGAIVTAEGELARSPTGRMVTPQGVSV
jgi:dihydroorotase